jgi:hypothetical protein
MKSYVVAIFMICIFILSPSIACAMDAQRLNQEEVKEDYAERLERERFANQAIEQEIQLQRRQQRRRQTALALVGIGEAVRTTVYEPLSLGLLFLPDGLLYFDSYMNLYRQVYRSRR